jgi:hypothetical protein
METAHSRARTSKGPDGHPAMIDYRKLSNRKLHEILSVVAPRMSSFAITDETRETAIAMLEFTRTGQK